MKILIYSHEFPPFKGGAGIYSRDLAVGLASLGVDVHVLTERLADDAGHVDGIRVHFLADMRTVAAQGSLCRLQLSYRFDIILLTERRAQEDVARMPKGLFTYMAIVHGSEILSYFGSERAKLPVSRYRMTAFYDNAKGCIAVSRATTALVKRLFPGDLKCATVLNGIDTSRLPEADSRVVWSLRECRPRNARFIFCLGRLDLDKGHEVLIRAFASVRHSYPQAYLLIGGDGPYRPDLQALCVELGVDSFTEFLGEIPTAMLPAYFTLCDVFALTSKSDRRWEGFGLVYLEAGYYGKPVIGGNEGGVPEAISHMESGLLVNPRNNVAVAAGICTLLADVDLAKTMGARGRQRVLDYFNAKRMAEDTLRYLEAMPFLAGYAGSTSLGRLRMWKFFCALRLSVGSLGGLPRRVFSRIR